MTRAFATRLAVCLMLAWVLQGAPARAGYVLPDITNDAILYAGAGSTALKITDATVTGFVGIGDPNGNKAYLTASGSTVYGGIDYAATSINSRNSVTASTITWGVAANTTAVQTALTALSSLSTTLGGESGTTQKITAGTHTQTITATAGTLDGDGNYVFTVGTVSLSNGGVLTIDGTGLTGSQDVVFNITASNPSFSGAISLIGLNPDQVLFNVIGTSSLTINAGGATLNGDFLDYGGKITVKNATVDGRILGGGSSVMTIGAAGTTTTIDAPGAEVPEPSSLALLAVGVLGLAGAIRRRSHPAAG